MRFAEPMPDILNVRLGRDEKRRLFELARQRGMTLSAYVRHVALNGRAR